MLDVSLDLSVLLHFLPLPLVYRYDVPIPPYHYSTDAFYSICSPKLSSLSGWKPRSQQDEDMALDEDILKLVKFRHFSLVIYVRECF